VVPDDLVVSIDCDELLLPPAALGLLLDEDEPPGQEHGRLLDEPPAAELGLELLELEPLALDWPDELVLEEGDVLLLVDGDVELLVDGEVAPAAPLEVVPELGEVEPDALPEPEDWLVCAPCVIVEDGFVLVAFWLAEAEPVDTPWSPVPRLTPAPTLAPAFTSVLLMPTFAFTPTFGSTFTPPDGAVVEPPALLGCEVLDWLGVELWFVVEDDWAKAGPNAPITAAAVILTARCLILMALLSNRMVQAVAASAVPRLKRVGETPTATIAP
jgi:hypothetical protein